MWDGDKLYQKRARRALPLLVRQAKAEGPPISYGNLAEELCMPNARNLNFPLGSIGASLQLLREKWEDNIPRIQVLVVNKNTGLPGKGIVPFLEIDVDFPDQVKAEQARVYAYPRWDDVLRELNLNPPPPNPTLVEMTPKLRSGRRGGSESEEHKQLKKYVRHHPESLGIRHKSTDATPGERRLLSGDFLDVFFKSRQRWTAVEVKSAKSDKGDHVRGVFQCVKYEAVMEAEIASKGGRKRDFEVETILVVEGKLDPDLRSLANTLGVDVREVPVGIYRG